MGTVIGEVLSYNKYLPVIRKPPTLNDCGLSPCCFRCGRAQNYPRKRYNPLPSVSEVTELPGDT